MDIQDYYKYVIEKHETVTDNPPKGTCVNKIENKTEFKIKTGCYLELLSPGTMKLLGSTETKITKKKKLVKIFIIRNC